MWGLVILIVDNEVVRVRLWNLDVENDEKERDKDKILLILFKKNPILSLKIITFSILNWFYTTINRLNLYNLKKN